MIGKVYNSHGSFHAVKIKKKIYSVSGAEVKMKQEWLFVKGISFRFIVMYGFYFRDWLDKVKNKQEVSIFRKKSYMP